jgi:tetratricopeptide (TPR) repeat protein
MVFGQSDETDSLINLLPNATEAEKVKILNELTIALTYSDPERAIYYGKQADSIAYILGLKEDRTEALNNLGTAFSEFGNNQKAIELHLQALQIAEEINDRKMLAFVHNNLGVDYYIIGDFNNSINHNLIALSIKKEKKPDGETVGTPKSIASTMNNVGTIYDEMGNYDKALEYYKKGLQINTEINNAKGISSCLNNIGVVYEEKGEFELALDFYNRSLVLSRELGNNEKVAATLLNIGIVYLDLGDYTKALENHFQALSIFEKNSDLYETANISNSIADIYLEKNEPDNAYPYILNGLNTAQKIDAKKLVADSYRFMAKYHTIKGNYKQAFEAQQELLILKDSLFRIDMNGKVADMQTRYETEKKEKEIELLKKDTEIKQLAIDKQKDRMLLLLLLGGLIIILGLFIFSRYRLKQNTLRIILEKKNLETEQKLLRTQMNPHFIFNSLNSVQGYISSNNSFLAMTYLAKFAKLMRYILENSRKNMILLEDEVNALSLNMELERIRFKENFDFKIEVNEKLNPASLFIPPMLIQPFIENAMKHGLRNKEGKGLLELYFKPAGKLIHCIVRDNGIGREKASELNKAGNPNHKSIGMEVTSERIATLRQQFKEDVLVNIKDLKDDRGNAAGTEVNLMIPFEAE